MRKLHAHSRGATLTEAVVAGAIVSMVLGAVAAGMFTLQRSFAASQTFVIAHLEQVRTLDELKRDARSANAMEVGSAGNSVVLTIPGNEPGLLSLRLPSSVLGMLTSLLPPPASKTVEYSFSADRVVRTEAGESRVVAGKMTRFQSEKIGTRVNTTIAFPSRFGPQPAETPASTLSVEIPYRPGN